MLTLLVRGVGKKKGNKSSLLEPLSFVEIAYRYKKSREIQSVQTIVPDSISGSLFFDPIKSTIQLFLAEMLSKSLREEAGDEDLFDYLYSSISFFKEGTNQQHFHLIFLLKMTRFLGFFPNGIPSVAKPFFDLQNGEFCASVSQSEHTLNDQVSNDIYALMLASYENPLNISKDRRRAVLDSLVQYYRLHLEGFGEVRSLRVLKEVFS